MATIKTYEIFTDKFSQIIQAESALIALELFNQRHQLEVNCIRISDEHPTPSVSAEEVFRELYKTFIEENPDYYDFDEIDPAALKLTIAAMEQYASQFRTPAPEGDTVDELRYFILVDNDLFAEIDKSLLNRPGFEVVFGSSYRMLIENNSGFYRVCNAMNGYGNNCLDQFKKSKVLLLSTTPAPSDSLAATADEIKEGLQNSYWKETGDIIGHGYTNWLENKIVEYRQYVAAPVEVDENIIDKYWPSISIDELAEKLAKEHVEKDMGSLYNEQGFDTFKNIEFFKDGFLSGYQHKPAKGEGKDELQKLFIELTTWQKETFGEATPISKLAHLIQEAVELKDAIVAENATAGLTGHNDVRMEYADCFFLLFGSAAAYGFSYEDICDLIKEKFEINKSRKWGKPDENRVVNHLPTPPKQ